MTEAAPRGGLACFDRGGDALTLREQFDRLPKLLKVSEVCDYTGCHERTVRRWIRDGRLSAVESGAGIRVPRRSLWRFLGLDTALSA